MRAKILNASAGSGKTWQLAYKYVHDVVGNENPELFRHTLAVTFTNKATEEMKSRILSEIHKLAVGDESSYLEPLCRDLNLSSDTIRTRAREVQSCLLHDYSHFAVMTLDRFFQRLLRALVRELGLELNYNVEIETGGVLRRGADAVVERIRVDEGLRKWLAEFIEERVEEGKRWDVREGILSLGDEIFSERSGRDMADKETLERIVDEAIAESERTQAEYRKLCAEAIDRVKGVNENKYLRAVAAGETKKFSEAVRKNEKLSDITDFYDTHIRSWNTVMLLRENYRGFALMTDLRREIQRLCDEENIMMLADTKHILAEFIRGNDTPFIYEKVGNRFDRFLIDEFQDTSRREWENFLPLLHNAMAESTAESVLLVGDVKQSIYRWRGGDWRILAEEAEAALGDAEVVHLQENRRSLPEVVRFNNELISRIVAGDEVLQRAYTNHTQIPKKEGGGYVNVSTYDADSIHPIVERIRSILALGYNPCDILILTRTKDEGARVARLLLDHQFDVVTQEALAIGAAPISGFVIACLRLSVEPENTIARAEFNQFLGLDFAEPLSDAEVNFFIELSRLSPEEAFERIVVRFDLSAPVAYLQALHEQIIAFCTSRSPDTVLYLQYWDDDGCKKSLHASASASTIEILTIHKAKGLEKKVVIIPFADWEKKPPTGMIKTTVWSNGFPVTYKKEMGESDFAEDYERERKYTHIDAVNLLYVAVTRAVEQLHIFIRDDPKHIGKLVLDAVGVCEMGEFSGPTQTFHFPLSTFHLQNYPTSIPDLKLRVQGELDEDSVRRLGVLLHRAFEQARTEEEVWHAVESMRQDGLLTDTTEITEKLRRAFTDPLVASWFSGEWEEIRSESDIISPDGVWRPDRVMISPAQASTPGGRAVVVDYKFGDAELPSHRTQVSRYMDLLRRMGYTDVEGYVWYVLNEKVERV